MSETALDKFARDLVQFTDLSEMPDTIAKHLQLLRERPDLMWLENDSETERARKQGEFDALMVSREPKH